MYRRHGAPGGRDRKTYERQVHVPIGTRLTPDLNDADHRNQHAQEPAPSNGQPGRPAEGPPCNGGYCGKHQRGHRDTTGGNERRKWIEDTESRRPD
jgi:hypothetical protein